MAARLLATIALGLLVMPAPIGRAATLSPWTVTSATIAGSAHNGVAGSSTHLYTVTQNGAAEIAAINPDGSVGPWATGPSLLFSRQYGTLHAAGGRLYAVGGWQYPGGDPGAGGTETATVEVAEMNPDGSLTAWTNTTPMAFARSNHAAAIGVGRLYVLGDYGGSSSVESAAILPDGSLSAWRAEAPMLVERERPGAAVVGNHLYVVGGLPFSLTIERAAIDTDGVLGAWEFVAAIQQERYQVGVAAIGPFLFAMGGYNDSDGPFASTEVAAVVTEMLGAWQFSSPLTQPHSDADATAVDNRLYVIGPLGSSSVEFATLTGCGNAVVEAGEECDDGNLEAGDCCSSTCAVETSNPICNPDQDGDGLPDTSEPCICTGTASAAVVTTVGCSVEQVCPCAGPWGRAGWRKAGEYVRCLKEVTRELLTAGLISFDERRMIVRAGRDSGCGGS